MGSASTGSAAMGSVLSTWSFQRAETQAAAWTQAAAECPPPSHGSARVTVRVTVRGAATASAGQPGAHTRTSERPPETEHVEAEGAERTARSTTNTKTPESETPKPRAKSPNTPGNDCHPIVTEACRADAEMGIGIQIDIFTMTGCDERTSESYQA